MTAFGTASPPLLHVDGLSVDFLTEGRWTRVVDDVSYDVRAGEIVGLVGESGSGKSVSSLAVMRLLSPRNSRTSARALEFGGQPVLDLDSAAMRSIRGGSIAMIFQEPMTSLNPAFTVGNQIAEAFRTHTGSSRRVAAQRAVEMLDRVGIPDPRRRAKDYPHAFSGGMRQRAMIAMALACDPKLLIADEPTTALDVTIQAQILELVKDLRREFSMAVLFVTHDLGVVADLCDRVVVMYAGQVVEERTVDDVFTRPAHPYSAALLESMPQAAIIGRPLTVIPGQVPRPQDFPDDCRFAARCRHHEPSCDGSAVPLTSADGGSVRCLRADALELVGAKILLHTSDGAQVEAVRPAAATPLLEVHGLVKRFPVHSGLLRRVVGHVRAVDGVDLHIDAGETLGLVGESGSGKSTVARLITRLVEPTEGTVVLDGVEVTALDAAKLRDARRNMQLVFQDPYSSLDPRVPIATSIGEPLGVHLGLRGRERDERVAALLDRVGLGRHAMTRFPHEFSGGQRQRIAIARALALDPRLVICDEPVSSLDVSTQSQVINLLSELRRDLGVAFLFIAHDLSVVRHISDRIAVMYLGRIVESGPSEVVYRTPRHPYTAALLSAIPIPDPVEQRTRQRIVLQGDVPSPLDPPPGCRFHTRCPFALPVCAQEEPSVFTTPDGSTVACHLHSVGPALAGAPIAELAERVS